MVIMESIVKHVPQVIKAVRSAYKIILACLCISFHYKLIDYYVNINWINLLELIDNN